MAKECIEPFKVTYMTITKLSNECEGPQGDQTMTDGNYLLKIKMCLSVYLLLPSILNDNNNCNWLQQCQHGRSGLDMVMKQDFKIWQMGCVWHPYTKIDAVLTNNYSLQLP